MTPEDKKRLQVGGGIVGGLVILGLIIWAIVAATSGSPASKKKAGPALSTLDVMDDGHAYGDQHHKLQGVQKPRSGPTSASTYGTRTEIGQGESARDAMVENSGRHASATPGGSDTNFSHHCGH